MSSDNEQSTGAARGVAQAAEDVASSAKDSGRQVVREVSDQARNVTGDVRQRLAQEADTQNERLAGGLRRMADQLGEMAADRPDSPARMVVQRISDGGRQLADYLEQHGPDGMLREVQEYARRRPGVFLLGAAVAGFAVGRLGKGLFGATTQSGGTGMPGGTGTSGGTGVSGPAGRGRSTAAAGAGATGRPVTGDMPGMPGAVDVEERVAASRGGVSR